MFREDHGVRLHQTGLAGPGDLAYSSPSQPVQLQAYEARRVAVNAARPCAADRGRCRSTRKRPIGHEPGEALDRGAPLASLGCGRRCGQIARGDHAAFGQLAQFFLGEPQFFFQHGCRMLAEQRRGLHLDL